MRIYIFTDTHLGFKERDEELGEDSFRAFEEGLLYARAMRADLALHAGDLFDVQKPSQSAIHKAMQILGRYCLDGEALQTRSSAEAERLRVVSRHKPGHVYNFERAHLRDVPLPLFMIYGNHDPPVSHHDGNVVAPVDVLEAAYLVNDIGKHDELDPVVVTPVVVQQQGHTGVRIAIYGIGYIRDERMNRLFELGKIRFAPPPGTDCFCILLIHQNSYKGLLGGSGAPAKRCVHEEMLPNFLDLVIWGHEHDCEIELRDAAVSRGGGGMDDDDALAGERVMKITQPGSSVYTSLKRGEATFKRNALLQVGPARAFRFVSFPLLSPRPFIFRQVNVIELDCALNDRLMREATAAVADATDFAADQEIEWKLSMERVEREIVKLPADLLAKVRDTCCSRRAASGPGAASGDAPSNALPLIRLRVEVPYEFDLDSFSTTRFGIRFQHTVANCEDIVLITRASKGKKAKSGSRAELGAQERENIDPQEAGAEPLADLEDPENMIFEHVKEVAGLQIMEETVLNDCVKKYVDKSDLNVFEDFISITRNRAMRALESCQSGDVAEISSALAGLKSVLSGALNSESSDNPIPTTDFFE